MNGKHPITPPPELVEQWYNACHKQGGYNECHKQGEPYEPFTLYMTTRAARWGADQELEACCGFIGCEHSVAWMSKLRAARRPKPPTLKEQALDELTSAERLYPADWSTIRRALEALPND
jgi:hypothetical protein